MKTHSIFSSMATASLLLVSLLTTAIESMAQRQTPKVIAISKDGYNHKAPSSLKVAVFTQDKPMQFQLCMENSHPSYVEIALRDSQGHKLYSTRVYDTPKYVSYFDMSRLEEGLYIVEVENKLDKHRYQIKVDKRVVKDLNIKPYRAGHIIAVNTDR